MISVCSTIYNQPENLETFVRSLVGNATDKNFEIIIVDDENSCKEKLEELKKEFPQLKSIPRPKEDRVKFAQGLIDFYTTNNIFKQSEIIEMQEVLDNYAKEDIGLWLPTTHNFNLAASQAKGDLLLFLPADYYIFFDVSKVIEGHFDWLDITSVEPYPDFSILKTYTLQEEFKNYSKYLLEQAMKQKVATIQAQHGARVVSREVFDKIGGFDDRWFIRAIGEDLFNEKSDMTRLAGTILFRTLPYVGNIRGGRKYFNYLSPKYDINADNHWLFAERIRQWLS